MRPHPPHALALLLAAMLLAACGGAPSLPPTITPSGTPARTIAAGSATPAPPTPAPPAPPAPTATPVPQTGDTGIDGVVTIGPTCPVERPDSPCPDRPFEATIDVLDDQGRQIGQARSDAQGRFRVLLPPGTYTLQGRSATSPPHARPETATVNEGRLTSVHVRFDSGIR